MHLMLKTIVATGLGLSAVLANNALASDTYEDTLANFRIAPAPVTTGIFNYTFVSSTLPDTIGDTDLRVEIEDCCDGELGTIAVNGLSGLTDLAVGATYDFVYEVELFGADSLDEPDVRFQSIGLGAAIGSLGDPLTVTKRIVGQPTTIVPAPTFDETLEATQGATADTVTCGVCRKFLVTDTIFMDPDGNGTNGFLSSVNNEFNATPGPGTLALLGLGLAALGARRAARKNT